ncbi:hypothetical protein [Nostoc sp. 'Peltigera membranacea cyanobiont' 213]|uniref:hypothetical protein n=1 Tax=Nostoc sp. 'Peltigera membranacea cyanobiont' 213 TaxID=2014530 RepID=UPI00117D9FA6|nr:hypothetical protein [Nostoc sp. 'Peltigera membranacea cyanobiont' 213]
MVIAWITHQRRYQRQAKFIGNAIVFIPLPTCTLRDRMLVKVLYIKGSSVNRSLSRIKDKGILFCVVGAIGYDG